MQVEHKDIIDRKIAILKKIHESLAKEKYFGLTQDEAKQKLMVGIFISTEKEAYWQSVKRR